MDVSGTFGTSAVRLIDTTINGHSIYMVYVTPSSQLIVDKAFLDSPRTILLTSATVN
jgi:hypothetical protein